MNSRMLAQSPARLDAGSAAPISRTAARLAVSCSRAGSHARVRRMALRGPNHAACRGPLWVLRAVAQDVPPEGAAPAASTPAAAATAAPAAPVQQAGGEGGSASAGGREHRVHKTPLYITRSNFTQALPVLRQALQECEFFAFDCEMTGLFVPVCVGWWGARMRKGAVGVAVCVAWSAMQEWRVALSLTAKLRAV